MKLKTILNLVHHHYPIQVLNPPAKNSDILGLQLHTNDKLVINQSNFIYVITDSAKPLLSTQFPSVILTDTPQQCDQKTTQIVASKLQITHIQNLITTLLAYEASHYTQLADLSMAVLRHSDLQSSVNRVANILLDPVIIVDNAYKVIASSTNYDVTDPLWQRIIHDGYAPYSLLVEMTRIVANSNPEDKTEPFLVKCDLSPVHKMAIKLTYNHHDIGYIVMFNNPTEINDNHWTMIPHLAKIISELLVQTPKFSEMYGDIRGRTLKALLTGANKNRIDTLMQLGQINIPTQCTAIVSKMNSAVTQQQIKYYAEEIKAAYPTCFYNHQGPYVYLILACGSTHDDLNVIEHISTKLNLSVVVSGTYTDFFDSYNYLTLAKQALDVANQLGTQRNFSYTSDYSADVIMNQLPNQTILNYFKNPDLIKLQAYDTKNQTELFPTLVAYFKCNRSLKETAQRLYVHRNTLTNRMERIQSLIPIDFMDGEQLFTLEFNLKLMEFQHLEKASSNKTIDEKSSINKI